MRSTFSLILTINAYYVYLSPYVNAFVHYQPILRTSLIKPPTHHQYETKPPLTLFSLTQNNNLNGSDDDGKINGRWGVRTKLRKFLPKFNKYDDDDRFRELTLDEMITKKQERLSVLFTTEELQVAKRQVTDSFQKADEAIEEAQRTLDELKASLKMTKSEAVIALANVETELSSLSNIADAVQPRASIVSVASGTNDTDTYSTYNGEVFNNLDELTFEDIDYDSSEMTPFIGEDMCLVPGVPLVNVEKAPDNSRRIFAGIDILASVDTVWNLLTDYENLQQVIPNLVVNEVQETYEGDPDTHTNDFHEDPSVPPEVQCKNLAMKMKGSKLRQIGGAKVVGINFSARTTLEVREWPEGLPDFVHFNDDKYKGKSREQRVSDSKMIPLQRYRFPRPFAISKLPTKDISMQSVENDDGEFRMYQGVWRMQPLPGCVPEGMDAMRLTYAVEISPRPYLPVRLVEGRIANDLCSNLEAIRDFVTPKENEIGDVSSDNTKSAITS